MIVVTGATGNVGRPLVQALVAAGEQVTAVSRRPPDPPAGRHRQADLTDPRSLGPVLDGADALFLLVVGENPRGILDVAKASGVRRVVLLSSQGAGTRPESYHQPRTFEDAVRQSGLDWTILRPAGFDSNAFLWMAGVRAQRTVAAPFPDVGLPTIDPSDIAEASYLWRHVLPAVGDPGRRLAPDLIGMGDSGKPDIEYTFDDHARYLDAWFDALGLDSVVLIGHDWGGALAFDWAARHPGRVRGIAFTETIVKPMSWQEFPEGAHAMFRSIRTSGVGEAMILDENAFIEQVLPGTVATRLSDDDLDTYRKPYPTRSSRLPLLQWPRAMPLDGEPAEVVARITSYDEWLATSVDVPKLLLTFDPGPGTMMGPEVIEWCAANMADLDIDKHGLAGHHTPEDQPAAIAAAIAAWVDRHDLRSAGDD